MAKDPSLEFRTISTPRSSFDFERQDSLVSMRAADFNSVGSVDPQVLNSCAHYSCCVGRYQALAEGQYYLLSDETKPIEPSLIFFKNADIGAGGRTRNEGSKWIGEWIGRSERIGESPTTLCIAPTMVSYATITITLSLST